MKNQTVTKGENCIMDLGLTAGFICAHTEIFHSKCQTFCHFTLKYFT